MYKHNFVFKKNNCICQKCGRSIDELLNMLNKKYTTKEIYDAYIKYFLDITDFLNLYYKDIPCLSDNETVVWDIIN